MSEIETITLTTAHSASSYGRPVLVVDGDAYGPADLVGDEVAADLVRQWAARFGGADMIDALAADLRRLTPDRVNGTVAIVRTFLDVLP